MATHLTRCVTLPGPGPLCLKGEVEREFHALAVHSLSPSVQLISSVLIPTIPFVIPEREMTYVIINISM